MVFQTYRADWGATADRMSFIIPKGIPWLFVVHGALNGPNSVLTFNCDVSGWLGCYDYDYS